MKKIQRVGTISEFVNGKHHHVPSERKLSPTTKAIIKIGAYTLLFIVVGPHLGFAAGHTMGATGIDQGASTIYYKLCSIGKWVIIIKGGWETINAAVRSDFNDCKKNFLQYGIVYAILLAFPWIMDQVDTLFHDVNATGGGVGK